MGARRLHSTTSTTRRPELRLVQRAPARDQLALSSFTTDTRLTNSISATHGSTSSVSTHPEAEAPTNMDTGTVARVAPGPSPPASQEGGGISRVWSESRHRASACERKPGFSYPPWQWPSAIPHRTQTPPGSGCPALCEGAITAMESTGTASSHTNSASTRPS